MIKTKSSIINRGKLWKQVVALFIGFASAAALYNVIRNFDLRASQPHLQKQIGVIETIQGQVERRASGAAITEPVNQPGPLYHQDVLLTQRGASVTVRLTSSESVLKLLESSRLVVEDDPNAPGHLTATWLDGELEVIEPGRKDFLKIYHFGQEIEIESVLHGLHKHSLPMLDGSSNLGPSEPEPSQLVITATTPSETPIPQVALKAPTGNGEKINDWNSEVLTNEEIVRHLRLQAGFFQRCYLSHLHRLPNDGPMTQSPAPAVGGTIVLAFTIQTGGKVIDPTILRSDFKDVTLNECVREVVDRTVFTGFTGRSVPVREFPIVLE